VAVLPEKSGMGSGCAFLSFVDVTARLAESNIPLPATFPRDTLVMASNDLGGIFRHPLKQLNFYRRRDGLLQVLPESSPTKTLQPFHTLQRSKGKLDAARASGNEPQIEVRAEHMTGE
jgi:hypothetical protein